MRNLRLDICYDGTKYKGFQRLPGNQLTIQGKLEQTLTRLLGETIEISGSGRTDAGTHALGQVVSFHCDSTMSCDEILAGLRKYLPEDIGAVSLKNASPRFHARLNAKSRKIVSAQVILSDILHKRNIQFPQIHCHIFSVKNAR